MKAQIQKQMKKTMRNRILISLSLALAFVALLGMLKSAEAKVVVRVGVVTPHVRVHVDNGPQALPPLRGTCEVMQPLPPRVQERRPRPRHQTRVIRNQRGMVRKLRKEDRQIARRLQRSTGVDKNLMLGYRRAGWTWPEIAFELRIRRSKLAAAMGHQHKGLTHAGLESCTYQFNHR